MTPEKHTNRAETLATLRSMGLNVIPVDAKTKIPRVEWKEYQTVQYTGEYPPDADLGVVCGQTSGNLLVIDLDDPKLYDDFEKFDTFTVKTGRGIHVYFRVEKEVPKGGAQKDGMHLDIQCGGSYVVAPGSTHKSGRKYEIIRDAEIMITTTDMISAHFRKHGYAPVKKTSKINAVREGSRNSTMFAFACDRIEKGLSGAALDHVMDDINTKFVPPLDAAEVREIARKAEKRLMTRRPPVQYDDKKGDPVPLGRVTTAYEGKYVRFTASVIAAGKHMTYVIQAEYQCPSCHNIVPVRCDTYLNIDVPWCPECHKKMRIIQENRKTNDAQYVILQELLDDSDRPTERTGLLLGDMTGTLKPGDRMVFGAVFHSFPGTKSMTEPTLIIEDARPHGTHDPDPPSPDEVAAWRADPDLFETMRDKIAPHILIPDEWRETCMLAMAGATCTRRPMIHVMFLGDAQTGKSELMRSAMEIYTGGASVDTNATTPGLLIAMRRLSDGTMIPTTGLIPMHDRGLVGLDEIDKLDERVRNDLLTPMESGAASMAKAGYPDVSMPARTTIIATGNPKHGRIDPNAPHIFDNFTFTDSFLSRFDVVWMVRDERGAAVQKAAHSSGNPPEPPSDEVRRYFRFVKSLPVDIPDAIHARVRAVFAELIAHAGDYPVGQRHYQGMLRMVSASARLHLRECATDADVDIVRNIMSKSISTLVRDGRSLMTSAKLELESADWKMWTESGGDKNEFLARYRAAHADRGMDAVAAYERLSG